MQTSKNATSGVLSAFTEFGGVSSLFRGISAPLYTAAFVNAIVFGSYGLSSRIYSSYYLEPAYDENDEIIPTHDPWQKAMMCGAFAGLMQCFVICPMEHVKCRLQTQHGKGSSDYQYKGPFQATSKIFKEHGIQRLFQGWWTTCFREVPAFATYFATYDYLKDIANDYIAENMDVIHTTTTTNNNGNNSTRSNEHSHTWLASAFAGGCAGCFTWAMVYPVDVIKTRIQTSPLTTPFRELSMFRVGADIVRQHGVRYLFRGLGITLIRAFPVNGTIFPVYEFTLKTVCQQLDGR
jgi:solute carrier family 25 (mitochondrial carnitine/acylcarnitine transporter), member 20/29